MEKITLKNFRCFREEQTARLAPLTLLVGENSSGKTSFMALIRALWDVAVVSQNPDLNFKEDPYDLGSFDEIVHHRGARGGREKTFKAGFDVVLPIRDNAKDDRPYHFKVTFGKRGTVPFPLKKYYSQGDNWVEENHETSEPYLLLGTCRGTWEWKVPDNFGSQLDLSKGLMIPHLLKLHPAILVDDQVAYADFKSLGGSTTFNLDDLILLKKLIVYFPLIKQRPFASAPVRSKPRRTYDPSRPTPDSEGDYVPMYLANFYFQDKRTWATLKEHLEDFGKTAGLFDEITIKPLGRRESEPFQVQVRKFDGRRKGPPRNLIDVGYGVSQVLPVITELLRQDTPPMFLLQQPEVHLHPSAQAALGSLFCQVAGPERQLIIETHSDHLLDRVRMDIRDGTTSLKPDDVSILYFERGELDVRIHSLRIDEEGNVLGAPEGYRRFFMEEVQRSLWKR